MTQNRDADRTPVQRPSGWAQGQARPEHSCAPDTPRPCGTDGGEATTIAHARALVDSIGAAVAALPLVVVSTTTPRTSSSIRSASSSTAGPWVNLTSGTSAQARETAAAGGAARQRLPRRSDPGRPDFIIIVYSGPRAAFDLYEPQPRSLAEATTYLGGDHALLGCCTTGGAGHDVGRPERIPARCRAARGGGVHPRRPEQRGTLQESVQDAPHHAQHRHVVQRGQARGRRPGTSLPRPGSSVRARTGRRPPWARCRR